MAAKGNAVGLLKQAWHEIPDIVAGSALAISSIIGCFAVYNYRKSIGDVDKKRYRFDYTDGLLYRYIRFITCLNTFYVLFKW